MTSEVLVLNVEEEWRKLPMEKKGRSLVTHLGIIEGEVLTYLEQHGTTALRQLIRDLEWPAPMITMAIGAAIRQGLVRAIRHDLEVVLEPEREWRVPTQPAPVPEVRGG